MAKLISKTYGDALFELAVEEQKLEELYAEAGVLQEVLSDNPDYDKMMLNPRISEEEKKEILLTVFKGRVSDEMVGFLLLLLQKERYKDLNLVLSYFIARVKEEKQIGVAYVTTALELRQEQKKQVEARLLETTHNASMEMHYIVDAKLIGGMVIRIGDRVIDSSIQTKLLDLKRQLYQAKLQFS